MPKSLLMLLCSLAPLLAFGADKKSPPENTRELKTITVVVIYASGGKATDSEKLRVPAGTTLQQLVVHDRSFGPKGCLNWTQGMIRLERLLAPGYEPFSLALIFRDAREGPKARVELQSGDIVISDGWGDY